MAAMLFLVLGLLGWHDDVDQKIRERIRMGDWPTTVGNTTFEDFSVSNRVITVDIRLRPRLLVSMDDLTARLLENMCLRTALFTSAQRDFGASFRVRLFEGDERSTPLAESPIFRCRPAHMPVPLISPRF